MARQSRGQTKGRIHAISLPHGACLHKQVDKYGTSDSTQSVRAISFACECGFSSQTVNHGVFRVLVHDAARAANPRFDSDGPSKPKTDRSSDYTCDPDMRRCLLQSRRCPGPRLYRFTTCRLRNRNVHSNKKNGTMSILANS